MSYGGDVSGGSCIEAAAPEYQCSSCKCYQILSATLKKL